LLDAVVLSDFLPQFQFERLLKGVQTVAVGERVHIPRHKRGVTVSYDVVHLI
jgi:hypothetical protein